MMKKSFVATFAVFSILIAGLALAQLTDKPEQFYGSVTINGAPAQDGVLVSAKFEGKDVGGTLTSGGNYNLVISMKEQYEGKAVFFYVQNVNINTQSVFQAGDSVRIDLSVTIAAPAPPAGGSTGGGGGGSTGGSSGGSTGGSSGCQEDWICTDWLDCTNGVQKRVCADVNRCNTTLSKPLERQDCVVPKVCEPGSTKCEDGIMSTCSGLGTTWLQSQLCEAGCDGNVCKQALAGSELSVQGGNPFTGMFSLEESWPYWIVIIAVIVILAWFFLLRKKPAARKK